MSIKTFDGKVALVTGSGSGIGRASALAFAKEGAKTVVADVMTEGGEKTVQMIKEAGGEAIFIKTDVSKAAEVEALINKIIEIYGQLDYAHNNAGIEGPMSNTAEYKEEDWDRVIGINLKGVWLCMKYEIKQMLKQGKGAIVNTASIAGLVGFQGLPAYTASKFGVVGITKSAALEFATLNIRINAVCPGVIQTKMVERLIAANPAMEAGLVAGTPAGRVGKPDEIAQAAVWLCSDGASFVTGHTMVVDGGYTAQ